MFQKNVAGKGFHYLVKGEKKLIPFNYFKEGLFFADGEGNGRAKAAEGPCTVAAWFNKKGTQSPKGSAVIL